MARSIPLDQLPAFAGQIDRRFPVHRDPDVSEQLAALRQDIAQLRADLLPPPSGIITGRAVLDAFAQLQRGRA